MALPADLGDMYKRIMYVAGLLASFGVPYLIFGDGSWKKWLTGGGTSAHATAASVDLAAGGPEGSFGANQVGKARSGGPGGAKLVGPPVADFGEVLRFDVSPNWVMTRWSRVSTVLAELDLEGLRVPLVTGTAPDDLAGSLTFYFDKQHQVQRLTFHGYTGDERKLAALVTQRYQLQQVQSLNAALYLAKWNGEPKSALRVALAPVVRNESLNTRLEVMLEINRPNANYGLSPELKELLEREQQTRRW
jgi:hypothetical protein